MGLWKATAQWDPDTFWWASLDGETFYEVDQDFTAERAQEIETLFASNESAEWKPMGFHRRFIDHMAQDPKYRSVKVEQLV